MSSTFELDKQLTRVRPYFDSQQNASRWLWNIAKRLNCPNRSKKIENALVTVWIMSWYIDLFADQNAHSVCQATSLAKDTNLPLTKMPSVQPMSSKWLISSNVLRIKKSVKNLLACPLAFIKVWYEGINLERTLRHSFVPSLRVPSGQRCKW